MSDAPAAPKPHGRIAALILLALGVALLLSAAVLAVPTAGFFLRATKTEGTFTGAIERKGGNHGGDFYHPMFRYKSADGSIRTFTSASGSTSQPYADGAKVPVYYDPAKPEDARLNSLIDVWMTPLLIGAVGALMTVIGLMLRAGFRRARRAAG